MNRVLVLFLMLLHCVFVAHATEVDDLLKRLKLLTAKDDISLAVNSTLKVVGEFDNQEQLREGTMAFQLKAGDDDIQLGFSQSLLTQLQAERSRKKQDEKVHTPVTDAMDRMGIERSLKLVDATFAIKQWVEEGTFIGSRKTETGMELEFSMPLDSVLDGNIEKYVDDFSSELLITLDQQGIPTKAVMEMQGKGSFLLIFSMRAQAKNEYHFDKIGDRLIRRYASYYSSHKSSFSEGESTLTIAAEIL